MIAVGSYTSYLFGGLGNELLDQLVKLEMDKLFEGKFTWSTIKCSGTLPKGRYGHVCLSNKNGFYIMGGARKFNQNTNVRECFNDIYQFKEDKNEWIEFKTAGSYIDARRNHVGCIVGKHIMIHGGINEQGEFLKDINILNLISLKWIEGNVAENDPNDFESGVAYHSCCLILSSEKMEHEGISIYKINEKSANKSRIAEEGMYFYGGKYRDGKMCDKLRILKMGKKVNKWLVPNIIGNAPEARYGHCMQYFQDIGIIAIYGGRNDELYKQTGSSCLEDIYILNLIDTLSWSKVNTSGCVPPTRYCFASTKLQNNLLVFGGLGDTNYCNSDLYYLLLDQNDVRKHKDDAPQRSHIENLSPRAQPPKQEKIGISNQKLPEVIPEDKDEEA